MALDWRILMYVFTHLLLHITATDLKVDNRKREIRFDVIGPEKPIFVKEGGYALLQMQLKPPIDAKHMEIKFNKDTPEYPLVHLYKEGTDHSSTQDPQFKGRTFLRTDNIHNGHFDLLLSDVVLLDNGSYVCYVRSESFHAKWIVHIMVSAAVPEPYIHIELIQDAQVNITYNIPEWHQEFEMWWEGNTRKNLTPLRMEKTQITIDQAGNYTCHVRNLNHGETRTATVSIAESLLQKHSYLQKCAIPIIVAVLSFAVSLWPLYERKIKPRVQQLLKDTQKQRLMDQIIDPQNQNLTNEVVSERNRQQHCITPFSEVDVLLDNSNASSKLSVSDDQKSVIFKNNGPDTSNPCNESFTNYFVLGCEGFTQGKYRWEVEVGCAEPWAVGIAVQSVSDMDLSRLVPDEGVWAVGLTAGQYQAFTSPVTALSWKDDLKKLKVYLDVDGGQLSFYYSGTRQHIYSHMWHYNEKVFPFIWTMDPNNPITVCSPAAADSSNESA